MFSFKLLRRPHSTNEYYLGERDRGLRYDRDVEDPLRPAHSQLDDATSLRNWDRFSGICRNPPIIMVWEGGRGTPPDFRVLRRASWEPVAETIGRRGGWAPVRC